MKKKQYDVILYIYMCTIYIYVYYLGGAFLLSELLFQNFVFLISQRLFQCSDIRRSQTPAFPSTHQPHLEGR